MSNAWTWDPRRWSLRHRLIAGFLGLGVIPACLVAGLSYWRSSSALETAVSRQLQVTANEALDKINRNLFERYGDVQAFAFHPQARGGAGEFADAANFYMKAYGLYDLMIVADASGRIVGVNTRDKDGNPVPGADALLGRSVAQEEWFQQCIDGRISRGSTYYSDDADDPLLRVAYGEPRHSLNFSAPVFEGGRAVRVWSNRASPDRVIGEILSDTRKHMVELGQRSAGLELLRKDGLVLESGDAARRYQTNEAARKGSSAAAVVGQHSGAVIEKDAKGVEQVSGFAVSAGALGFPGYGWGVVARVERREALAAAGSLALFTAILLLVCGAVITWIGVSGAASIVRPLETVHARLEELASGQGDLTIRLAQTSDDEIGRLSAAFNTFVAKLHDIIASTRDSAERVAQAAEELTGATGVISSGAQTQASSLEESTARLEQLTMTVRQNTSNAELARQLAAGARDVADRGGRVVSDAIGAMSEINTSSRQIAEITSTIDEIAFQTNLLALNAAVEAARAGEQGRGFAVVASEVRGLAQRSASAAKEIKDLIEDSVRKVEGGAALVNRSGDTLGEIVSAVKRVTDVVDEITSASQEQQQGIEEVSRAVGQIDRATQSSAAQTEELSATSGNMSEHARELLDLVGRFRLAHGSTTHPPGTRRRAA